MESFMNRIYLDIRMYSYGKFYYEQNIFGYSDIRMYSYGKFYEQNMFGYSYV